LRRRLVSALSHDKITSGNFKQSEQCIHSRMKVTTKLCGRHRNVNSNDFPVLSQQTLNLSVGHEVKSLLYHESPEVDECALEQRRQLIISSGTEGGAVADPCLWNRWGNGILPLVFSVLMTSFFGYFRSGLGVFFFSISHFVWIVQRMRECQGRCIEDIVSLVRDLARTVRKCWVYFSSNVPLQINANSKPTSCEPPLFNLVPTSDGAGVYSVGAQYGVRVIWTHKASR
jgi:hypothetical protein